MQPINMIIIYYWDKKLKKKIALTIKPYLHLNCVLMLNWIVWNVTAFDIENILTLNWIV